MQLQKRFRGLGLNSISECLHKTKFNKNIKLENTKEYIHVCECVHICMCTYVGSHAERRLAGYVILAKHYLRRTVSVGIQVNKKDVLILPIYHHVNQIILHKNIYSSIASVKTNK